MNVRDGSTAVAMPIVATEIAHNPDRLHALDAVRGGALLLGIVLHASASFLNGSQQLWIITDKSPSTTLSLLFFVLHIFRMAVFFFIAGFFAHLLFHRRGQRAFVRDRLRRIGIPLLVGWLILAPALAGCLIWGAWVMNGGNLPPAPPPDPNAPPLAFPLTHLWFLYVLLWFYGITLLVRRIVTRFDPNGAGRARLDQLVSALVRSPFGAFVLAVPTCGALMVLPIWRPWFGIPTPDESLLPNVAIYGVRQRLCVGLADTLPDAVAERLRSAVAVPSIDRRVRNDRLSRVRRHNCDARPCES